jgi:hypothetical protein
MPDNETITCPIQRTAKELYETFWRPENFPLWASGLSGSTMSRDEVGWKAEAPGGEGTIRITFTDYNDLGIMDHWVDLGNGRTIYVPLRIIEDGEGSKVMITIFRQPEMSSEKFAEDVAWAKRDLEALKALAECS